jgi:hypothetical protein
MQMNNRFSPLLVQLIGALVVAAVLSTNKMALRVDPALLS